MNRDQTTPVRPRSASEGNGILAYLAEILEGVAGVDPAEVTPEKSFTRDLDLDSLSLVEVVVATEQQFGIQVSDDQARAVRTVGDAVGLIASMRPTGRTPPRAR